MSTLERWIWILPFLIIGVVASLNLPICPSRVLVGLFCPGCGLTRATMALMRGDIPGMIHFHPLAPLLTPMMGWIFLNELLVTLEKVPKKSRFDLIYRLPRGGWIAIGVLAFGVWIARAMGSLGGLPGPLFEPSQSLLIGGTWPDG